MRGPARQVAGRTSPAAIAGRAVRTATHDAPELMANFRSLRERNSVERQAESAAAEQDGVQDLLMVDGTRVGTIVRGPIIALPPEHLSRSYTDVRVGQKYARLFQRGFLNDSRTSL